MADNLSPQPLAYSPVSGYARSMTTMVIEKLAAGQFAEAQTVNGHYTIRLHRDAANFAHVDVFSNGRIIEMGQGTSLLEAEMIFESKSLFYGMVDRAVGK